MIRPIGVRPPTPEEEARAAEEMAHTTLRIFDDKPEADELSRAFRAQGIAAYPQFLGCWDRYIIEGRRKSWSVPRALRRDGTWRVAWEA